MFLPLHAERVPPREVGAGEEPAFRIASQLHPGWRGSPIPRVDHPGAGEHAGYRREGQQGCPEGRQPGATARLGETEEPGAEPVEVQGSQTEVHQKPQLSVGDPHHIFLPLSY